MDENTADPEVAPAIRERRKQVSRNVRSLEAAAIAGVVYAVLSAIGLTLLSQYPSLSLDDEELTAWFDEGEHQTSLIIGLNLIAMSSVAFLWFVAVIRRRIGEREDRFFATVFLGSSLVYVSVWLGGAVAFAAPAVAMTVLDAGSVSEASASLAGGLGAGFLLVIAPRIQAVFVLTASSVILRARILSRWLSIVGYVIGIILFVAPLVWRPMTLLFPMWVFFLSVAIFVNRPDSTPDSAGESNGESGA
jgi:hypothetical protein